MTLAALIERVEKAQGPDRELDAQLWWELLADQEDTDETLVAKMNANAAATWDRLSPAWRAGSEIEHYTASLDAAIALCERVLPGWHWSVGPKGATLLDDETPGRVLVNTEAPTPALALVLALLRALNAQEPTGQGEG